MRRSFLSFVLLVFALPGCGSPPVPKAAGGIPDWYKVRFVLRYADGRRYEGECSWPEPYNAALAVDVRLSQGLVQPGKTVTSIREVEGTRAGAFPPHGHGTMTYPDGRKETGLWRNGAYAGSGE